MNSRRITSFLFYIAFWVIALFLFSLIRKFNINPHFYDRSLDVTIGYKMMAIAPLTGGVILGALHFFIDRIFNQAFFKKRALLYQLAFSVFLQFITIIILANIIVAIAGVFGGENIPDVGKGLAIMKETPFWAFIIFYISTSFMFSLLSIIYQTFGKEKFLSVLLGKYKRPNMEKKIFMFLDLKDATSIAEKLGKLNYSRMIQDCFFLLNIIVEKHQGSIYQYVGDEAVVIWDYKKEENIKKAIDCFKAFYKKLLEEEAFYMSRYKLKPEFKAGIHAGEIITTEIGLYKKDIAYHGNTINTASRIQSVCNDFNEKLLISASTLPETLKGGLQLKKLSKVLLKGKKQPIDIFAVKV